MGMANNESIMTRWFSLPFLRQLFITIILITFSTITFFWRRTSPADFFWAFFFHIPQIIFLYIQQRAERLVIYAGIEQRISKQGKRQNATSFFFLFPLSFCLFWTGTGVFFPLSVYFFWGYILLLFFLPPVGFPYE
jgi:hypothetical protein